MTTGRIEELEADVNGARLKNRRSANGKFVKGRRE